MKIGLNRRPRHGEPLSFYIEIAEKQERIWIEDDETFVVKMDGAPIRRYKPNHEMYPFYFVIAELLGFVGQETEGATNGSED